MLDEKYIHPARKINNFSPSVYSNKPAMHAYQLPEMVSVHVKDLFPTMPDAIYQHEGDDLSKVRESTLKSLENVDMSNIKPTDTVDIITCEHGYLIFGGLPYIEMIKTIKEVVQERTGAFDIAVKVVMYRTPREGEEVLDFFRLKEVFGKVEGVTSYEKGIPFETRLGTVWGLEKVFEADKFIFAYYDDPREVYCSHYYRKCFKAFTMDMMRLETRTLFHYGFGFAAGTGPVAMVLPTSVYDSDFVQSKWAFCSFLRTTPNGLTNVASENSLYDMDDQCSTTNVKYYPYMHQLLVSLKDYSIILDGSRWPPYMGCAGLISGINMYNYQDHYDLSVTFTYDDFMKIYTGGKLKAQGFKCLIMNQTWYGLTNCPQPDPPIVYVGDEIEFQFKYDSMNQHFLDYPDLHKVATLPEAVKLASEIAGTDKIIVYDGSYGYVNCTRSAAEELFANAAAIKDMVDNKYPMYMEQRGLEIPDYMK